MSNYQFSPLKDEKEFESLVNDLCEEKYDFEFQVYGRKGQKQSGIDGLSFSKNEKKIVYQCKNKLIIRDDKEIRAELLEDLENEVKSASAKFPNIDTFIFANSFKQDTALQDKAADMSRLYGFTVIVWSWEEIEGLLEKNLKVAKQYYPHLFDKSILTEQDIKQKFQENSVVLLSSSSFYIEKTFIEMPEVDKIFEFIESENYQDDLLILTGKAGIGKTALLSKIQIRLIENHTAYLSIKSDKFDLESKDSFSKCFGVENILHSIRQLARKEKVVVLIDQLDALSLTMSSNQKTITFILEFIEQLKYISNVKIIASIREYDLKNDPLFKNLDDSKKIITQPFSFEYVNKKLKSFIKESTKLSNTLIELLRTPLHLSIFIELYPNDDSCISIKTLQDLYDKFWEQKVNSKLIDQAVRQNVIKLLNAIVQKMNEIKKIEVPILYFVDEFEEALSLLLSNGILKQENKKISFFHQTFYDYAFARDFAKKGVSLFAYILTTSQDLSIREQFKQIIQFLRGTDEEKYLLELETILYSEKVRFHIKLLLISYLGSLENPTAEEFASIQKLFRDNEKFEKYFIESWISSDWLVYFKEADFFTNENFKTYNLHHRIEIFVNKEPALVLEILDKCECDAEIKNEAIMLSLERLDKWDESSFEVFQKYHHLIYESNVRFSIEKVYQKVYFFNQEYAISLFLNFLDTSIEKADEHNIKELLDYTWFEIFEFLLETDNINVFARLLKSIQKISNKFKNEYSKKEFLITDQVFDSFMLNESPLRVYQMTLQKISQLALDDKDRFLELMKPYQNTRYLALIAFSIFGYSKNPQEYKNEILILLTNQRLLEEITFEHDDGYEFAQVLMKSFQLYDEADQTKIFYSILQVNPEWERSAFLGKWDQKSVYLGTYRGCQKYRLLCQLDIESIRKFGYFKEFQELERKFPWYKLEKPHTNDSGFSFAGAPLSTEVYKKMNLKHWIQSMKVFNGTNSRKSVNGFLRGNRTEHHRQFEKEVTDNPNKFFDFLMQLKSESIHPDYLSAGLSGLITSNSDEEKILKIVHFYADIDNTWLKRTLLKAMKHLIQKNKFDASLINILEADQNIKCENLVQEEKKFQTIDNHISRAINSFEGDFAELLPLVYKSVFHNEEAKKRVLKLIGNVIDENVYFVIFGLLRTLDKIESVDKTLFASLLLDIIKKDETGQASIYSFRNFDYLYINSLVSKEQLIAFIKKCLSFAKQVKDQEDSNYVRNLGMFLFYYYLYEKDEIFEKLLNEAIESNTRVIPGILHQIFEQEIHSKDTEKVAKSKQFILKFKNSESNDYFYTFDLTKMNSLNFIQNDFDFIKNLAQSTHIKKEMRSFIEYLQKEYHLDTTISEKIFELLEELIHNIDFHKDMGYYDPSPLIEFILELNTRTKSDEKKILILDLMDKFLMSDSLRHTTKSVID